MSATQDFVSGKASRAEVNSVVYDGKGWSVENTGTEQRTDNTSTNGYSDRIVVMDDLKATLEFDWDASLNLLDAPPNFKVGTILTGVKLYLDKAASSACCWSVPKAIVLSVSNPAKVGDKISITITIGNKGAFTPPTGTFVPSAIGT